jgi:uncharacterized protein YdhG (YjbR/CyaY superfamily)
MRAEQVTDPVAYHGEGPVWSGHWGGLRWMDMLAGDNDLGHLRPGPDGFANMKVVPSNVAEGSPAMTDTQKSAKRTTKASTGFTDQERAAMRERAREQKAAARKADGESEVRAKIAEMPEPDRALAERLHAIITASAPALAPRTWYGMPAYVKDGNVVCFFQSAQKFNTRYATLGFSDKAKLDDGAMWPVAFALTELTAAEEARIGALVKKAVS